jgi:hypothetical protein
MKPELSKPVSGELPPSVKGTPIIASAVRTIALFSSTGVCGSCGGVVAGSVGACVVVSLVSDGGVAVVSSGVVCWLSVVVLGVVSPLSESPPQAVKKILLTNKRETASINENFFIIILLFMSLYKNLSCISSLIMLQLNINMMTNNPYINFIVTDLK